MLDVTCGGCERGERVAGRFAGLEVSCSRCGAVNAVPEPDADRAYHAAWREALAAVAEGLAGAGALGAPARAA